MNPSNLTLTIQTSGERLTEWSRLADALADSLVSKAARPTHWEAYSDTFLKAITQFYVPKPPMTLADVAVSDYDCPGVHQ